MFANAFCCAPTAATCDFRQIVDSSILLWCPAVLLPCPAAVARFLQPAYALSMPARHPLDNLPGGWEGDDPSTQALREAMMLLFPNPPPPAAYLEQQQAKPRSRPSPAARYDVKAHLTQLQQKIQEQLKELEEMMAACTAATAQQGDAPGPSPEASSPSPEGPAGPKPQP